jgi:hypothetical protein
MASNNAKAAGHCVASAAAATRTWMENGDFSPSEKTGNDARNGGNINNNRIL